MCGRYALFRWPAELGRLPGFPADHPPQWNLAPGARVLAIREIDGQPEVVTARWGLTPPWLTDFSRTPAQARAETLGEQPMFREPYRQRRALLPANGFYEWRGARKRPYWMSRDNHWLMMAALWECYSVGGQDYFSVAVVTRAAADKRRPLVLDAEGQRHWLSSASTESELGPLLTAAQPVLRERALATLVNDPASNGPECLTPA